MSNCEYVQNHYGVPAEIGRRVKFNSEFGTIAEDRGHYIGVNFDRDKPGKIFNVHPTDDVEYLDEIAKVRKVSRGAARYARFLEYGDCFRNFVDYCRWDADPERSWNGGRNEI